MESDRQGVRESGSKRSRAARAVQRRAIYLAASGAYDASLDEARRSFAEVACATLNRHIYL